MAARKRSKVSVSTQTNTYRLSANERREARFAEISNKQADLKREAAERRANAGHEANATTSPTATTAAAAASVGEASVPPAGGSAEQTHPA
jgi:hypothetical protein